MALARIQLRDPHIKTKIYESMEKNSLLVENTLKSLSEVMLSLLIEVNIIINILIHGSFYED